jgi:predicted nucleic acid-binding protein
MVLVDTSIWINYLRGHKDTKPLSELLLENQVTCHQWILGELLLGHLGPRRKQIINDIDLLPKLQEYPFKEIRDFVEKEALHGKGLSFVDVQLLYACLVEDHLLWTDDRQLYLAATHYGKAFKA